MKKNIKIIFTSVVLFVFFLLSYNFSSAAGCCVKDTSSSAKKGADNCIKKAEKTTACSGKYFDNDPDCNKAITSDYCGGTFLPSDPDAKGCCIVDNSDATKSGPSNCLSNKKKSECSGANSLFDAANADCSLLKSARCESSSGSTTEFPNPLSYDSLSEVLVAVLVNLQSFLALIAIIIIIVGGIMYMFSSGNETMITRAKTTIGGALIGLAIILAAPSFIKQIKIVLGGDKTGATPDEIVNKAYSFKDIAISVINFLLSTIGILGIIALVVGGVMYVTAYGSEDRIDLAKKIIGSALVGILIAFGALILVKQIASLLGAA